MNYIGFEAEIQGICVAFNNGFNQLLYIHQIFKTTTMHFQLVSQLDHSKSFIFSYRPIG